MAVLRAEREEGWLILSFVTPPSHNSRPSAKKAPVG